MNNKFRTSIFLPHLLFIFGILICIALIANLMLSKDFDSTSNQKHIAVLIPGSVTFFDIQTKAIRKAADKHNLQLTIFNAGWDPFKQIQQLQNALSFGVDAIALATVDNQALKMATHLVAEQNIPLVTFTNAIGGNPFGRYENVISHIGRDEIESGRLLAKEIELIRPKEPTNILLFQGAPGTTPQRLREKGFFEIAAAHKNWNVIESITIESWDSNLVEKEMQKFINSRKPIDVIATQWADAAVAVSHILKNTAIQKKIPIVSLEFSNAIQVEMIKGTVSYTTNYSIAREGELTIETVAKLLKGIAPEPFIPIEQTIIDASQAINITAEY